ncbi:hypothetical protein O181_015316 [Austropuccinia psidii MF-1]|uniref:Uncharacterized protein n=1 Tax=Austropuccinia psidii MF-1 TaxID=1389203 RepID=A0A9Q3GQ04_9BASI|nr:hypothetical protein [Austropuccinia psidii MF-1]
MAISKLLNEEKQNNYEQLTIKEIFKDSTENSEELDNVAVEEPAIPIPSSSEVRSSINLILNYISQTHDYDTDNINDVLEACSQYLESQLLIKCKQKFPLDYFQT